MIVYSIWLITLLDDLKLFLDMAQLHNLIS